MNSEPNEKSITSSPYYTLNNSKISSFTKGSEEFNEYTFLLYRLNKLIGKLVDDEKESYSVNSNSKALENETSTVISNFEKWALNNNNKEDSKLFYKNYQELMKKKNQPKYSKNVIKLSNKPQLKVFPF